MKYPFFAYRTTIIKPTNRRKFIFIYPFIILLPLREIEVKWKQYQYSRKPFYLPNATICTSANPLWSQNNSVMNLFFCVTGFYLQKLTFYNADVPDECPLWWGSWLFRGYLLWHDTCPGGHVVMQFLQGHWCVTQEISVQCIIYLCKNVLFFSQIHNFCLII